MASDSQSIPGESFRSHNHRPRTYGPGRRCSSEGCTTLLSIYNESDRCSAHDSYVNVPFQTLREPALQTA